MSTQEPVAIVTGANRGIGREVSRQLAEQGFTVLLTARSLQKAETAAAELDNVNTFIPLLRQSQHPRIVNVSSGGGALTGMRGGTPAYSMTKASLNVLTLMLADELRSDRILVNAICPGWVATDMGGGGGRPVKDGAKGLV